MSLHQLYNNKAEKTEVMRFVFIYNKVNVKSLLSRHMLMSKMQYYISFFMNFCIIDTSHKLNLCNVIYSMSFLIILPALLALFD